MTVYTNDGAKFEYTYGVRGNKSSAKKWHHQLSNSLRSCADHWIVDVSSILIISISMLNVRQASYRLQISLNYI